MYLKDVYKSNEKICGIYMIDCIKNNKKYIGMSTNIHERIKKHINNSKNITKYSSLLYDDMNNFGIDFFTYTVLEIFSDNMPSSQYKLIEASYINHYDTLNSDKGYNKYAIKNNKDKKSKNNSRKKSIPITKNETLFFNIVKDLRENILSISEISMKYSVGDIIVYNINTGRYSNVYNLEYPIRQKKKKEVFFCSNNNCKNIITRGSLQCSKCYAVKQSKSIVLSKEELIDMLKMFPFTTVGNYCGVSDNAIRKWCEKYKISKFAKDYK